MSETVKIGLAAADPEEFRPIKEYILRRGGTAENVLGHGAARLSIRGRSREAELLGVCCGIGKVNAATVGSYLAASGVRLLANCGLSGGIGEAPGGVVVGRAYVEHDFDLTALGYAPGEKPGQGSVVRSDPGVADDLCRFYGCGSGVFATGDCFVSDPAKARFLRETYGAVACDMETAALAAVCRDYGIPFACVRRISDAANEDAPADYTGQNTSGGDWTALIVRWIETLTDRV